MTLKLLPVVEDRNDLTSIAATLGVEMVLTLANVSLAGGGVALMMSHFSKTSQGLACDLLYCDGPMPCHFATAPVARCN